MFLSSEVKALLDVACRGLKSYIVVVRPYSSLSPKGSQGLPDDLNNSDVGSCGIGSLRNVPSEEHGRAYKYSVPCNRALVCDIPERWGWRTKGCSFDALAKYCFCCVSSSHASSSLHVSGNSLHKRNKWYIEYVG